jgi:hypothetical protein
MTAGCRSLPASPFILNSGSETNGGCRPGPASSRCGGLDPLNLLWLVDAARRVVSRALNALDGQARGLTNLLKSFSSAVRHVDELSEGNLSCVTRSVEPTT